MRYRMLGIWPLVGMLALMACARVEAASLISYQGKLTNSAGAPVADGNIDVSFGLFTVPTGGTAVWTENRTVQTFGGVFSVLLGSLNPLPASAFEGETWLETVVGAVALSPRIQLVTAGYAHVAAIADTVTDTTITTNKLVDYAVTENKIENNSITRDRLAANSITTQTIADGAITSNLLSIDLPLNQALRSSEHVWNVREFGAWGNGTTDDTAAFQAALDAAGAANGGVVFVPTSRYKIAGHLSIPSNVILEGVFQAPPRMIGWADTGVVRGSILLAYEGEGNPTGTPFITLGAWNSGVKGLIIYYPNQPPTLPIPVAFPWTIQAINANNAIISDVTVVNSYQCVNIDGGGKHNINRLIGQALYRGIVVDNCSEMRIKDVHFCPFNTGFPPGSQTTWQTTNGISFIFKKCDWLYVTNAFVLGYYIGMKFEAGANGSTQGTIIGMGCDACGIDVQVDSCATGGLLFVNGEFVADMPVPHTTVSIVVGSGVGSNAVKLNNCSFWGPSLRLADVSGGTVSFTNCNMSDFYNVSGNYAVHSTGGRLTVRNCFFRSGGGGVWAGAGTTGAIIVGNQGLSSSEIKNDIGTACVTASNKS